MGSLNETDFNQCKYLLILYIVYVSYATKITVISKQISFFFKQTMLSPFKAENIKWQTAKLLKLTFHSISSSKGFSVNH